MLAPKQLDDMCSRVVIWRKPRHFSRTQTSEFALMRWESCSTTIQGALFGYHLYTLLWSWRVLTRLKHRRMWTSCSILSSWSIPRTELSDTLVEPWEFSYYARALSRIRYPLLILMEAFNTFLPSICDARLEVRVEAQALITTNQYGTSHLSIMAMDGVVDTSHRDWGTGLLFVAGWSSFDVASAVVTPTIESSWCSWIAWDITNMNCFGNWNKTTCISRPHGWALLGAGASWTRTYSRWPWPNLTWSYQHEHKSFRI